SSPFFFFSSRLSSHRLLYSFPTRRSSDLPPSVLISHTWFRYLYSHLVSPSGSIAVTVKAALLPSLLSVMPLMDFILSISVTLTRSEEHTLNSSHVAISYAVFCLKKKTNHP